MLNDYGEVWSTNFTKFSEFLFCYFNEIERAMKFGKHDRMKFSIIIEHVIKQLKNIELIRSKIWLRFITYTHNVTFDKVTNDKWPILLTKSIDRYLYVKLKIDFILYKQHYSDRYEGKRQKRINGLFTSGAYINF